MEATFGAEEIKAMSTVERLQAMEALWDALTDDDALPSPNWHTEVLTERRRKIAEGSAHFLTLDALKDRHR